MASLTEENYLKAIFKLSEKQSGKSGDRVSTNAIAAEVQTAAASVTDMLKRLSEKKLVSYQKYKGARLSARGDKLAKDLIRKHRLWEVFLMHSLGFTWDEVHDMAEDLEHIDHPNLIDRLEEFLDFPRFDPHGDPIPDRDGKILYHEDIHLHQLEAGEEGIIVGVEDHAPDFLRFLDKVGLVLQTRVKVLETEEYDNSRVVQVKGKPGRTITEAVGKNLIIRRVK